MEEWQRHIKHTHAEKQGLAWCGAKVHQFDWCYLDIAHAAYSAPNDRIQPCPECVKAIARALAGNSGEGE